MSFAQQLIGRMRDILDSSDQSQTSEFMDTASEYLELCRSANDRLRRCSHFLRQNLRTEAIHLAEADPNLLDLVAILDFPERQEWRKLCATHGIPEPPSLDIDSAVELNEAYALVEPQGALLIRHRRLALAMAPLSERLAVMRKLSELDPASTFWQQDIRVFEDARIEELRWQLNQPGMEESTAERLKREIDTAPWVINFPPELKKAADAAAARLRDRKVLRDLELLMPDLDAAYEAMDEKRCETLAAQCSNLLSEAGSAAPDLLRQRIMAVQSWLERQRQAHHQQQEFQNLRNALEQAMDNDAPTVDVRKAYLAVTKYGAELPEELQDRYQKFIGWREEQISRKRKLILLVSAVTLTVLLVIAIVVTLMHMHGNAVNNWVQQLTTVRDDVVNNGDEQSAQTVLASLAQASSGVRNDPAVASAASSLQEAITADQQRAANFQKAFASAQSLGVTAAGANMFDQAEQLARTPAEKQQLQTLGAQINAFEQQQQTLHDDAFSSAAGDLQQKIQYELTYDILNQSIQSARQALADLKNQVDALAARTGVSSDLKNTQIDFLMALIKQGEDKIAAQQSDQQDYQQIFQAPSNVAAYAASVNNYLQNHPDGVYAAQVKLLAGPLAAESAVEAWSGMTANWTESFLTPDMAQAEDRVSAMDQYMTQYQAAPFMSEIQAYRSYMDAYAKADSDDGPWKQSLAQILNKPLLHDLQFLQTTDGKIYYIMPGSQVNQSNIGDSQEVSFKAVTSSDLTQSNLIGMAASQLVSTTPQDSPEAQFSHQALDQIDAMQINEYVLGLNLLDALRKSSVNPIVKGILVNDLIILDSTLLPADINDEFNPTINLLKPLGLENINWLDPDNPPSETTVDTVNDAVNRLPDINLIENTLLLRQRQMVATLQFQVQGLAVINKTSQGISLITTASPTEGMNACVLLSTGDQSALTKIGTYSGGAWTFDQIMVGQVQTGMLVFLVTNGSGGSGN